MIIVSTVLFKLLPFYLRLQLFGKFFDKLNDEQSKSSERFNIKQSIS